MQLQIQGKLYEEQSEYEVYTEQGRNQLDNVIDLALLALCYDPQSYTIWDVVASE